MLFSSFYRVSNLVSKHYSRYSMRSTAPKCLWTLQPSDHGNDLIAHLRKITGSASEVVYSDKHKGDAEHTLADTNLAKELIGYRLETTIEKGLNKFVTWNPESYRIFTPRVIVIEGFP